MLQILPLVFYLIKQIGRLWPNVNVGGFAFVQSQGLSMNKRISFEITIHLFERNSIVTNGSIYQLQSFHKTARPSTKPFRRPTSAQHRLSLVRKDYL